MPIYTLLIYDDQLQYSYYHLDDISFIYRYHVKTVMLSFITNMIKKCERNTCYKIIENFDNKDMMIYCTTYDKTMILITDLHYPHRTAMQLLKNVKNDNIHELCDAYQVDKLVQVKEELEETKIILMQSIDALIARGSNMDDLLLKAESLNVASEGFARDTRNLNRCCNLF